MRASHNKIKLAKSANTREGQDENRIIVENLRKAETDSQTAKNIGSYSLRDQVRYLMKEHDRASKRTSSNNITKGDEI